MKTFNGVSQNTVQQKQNIDGVQNWTILFLCILAANLVIDNILKYGLVTDPIQLTFDFLSFLQDSWWIFVALVAGCALQLAMIYLTEIGLSKNLLRETFGITLQLFNTLLLYNIFGFLVTTNNVNICAGIAISVPIFLHTIKAWSFVYVNRTLRLRLHEKNLKFTSDFKQPKDNKEVEYIFTLKYPENLTLKNFIIFMMCTGKVVYEPHGLKKRPRNLKKFFLRFLMAVAIYYLTALILYQLIIPELHEVGVHLKSRQYIHCLSSLLKLLLPVNVAWIMFFYLYCFKFYLPSFGWLYGTEDIICNLDWWNSENVTIFWTKWNYQVHAWCKECIFLPVMQCGYDKRTAALTVSFISGILHEYLLTVPCRGAYGLGTIAMMAQVPISKVTGQIQRICGERFGNLSVWLMLILGHPTICLLIYYLLQQ